MNTIERIRDELRQLQAIRYTVRVRRELSLTPDDPDLRWALRELDAELRRPHPSSPHHADTVRPGRTASLSADTN